MGACAGRRRLLCYENLGSETGTGDWASWRDDARVAVCRGKDRGKWGMGQGDGSALSHFGRHEQKKNERTFATWRLKIRIM